MRTHAKHVLMCTGPRCSRDADPESLYLHLGRTLDACPGIGVKRTRSHCFSVCREGPVMVVYPDGIWYRRLDEAAVERIVHGHLAGGTPLETHVFHRTGLGDTEAQAAS